MNLPKRQIILSVDYEIFGNGGGDVLQHIVRPTEAMARICERHNVPLTVFFEAEEYLAFEKYDRELTTTLGYSPADAIRSQLISLVRAGHDVQLHLHPEWYGAKLVGGKWHLNPEKRAVDHLFDSQEETTVYIRERKEMIEDILSAANPQRRVRVYRAGAFTAQPGRKLIPALADNGILIDSSVVKGLRVNRPGGIDYRSAPSSKGPWRVGEDVGTIGSSRVWEFPVYSKMGRRFNQLTFGRLRAKFSRNVPKDRQYQMMDQLGINKRNPLSLMRFLCQPTPIKFDFHNLSPGSFHQFAKTAPLAERGLPDVVVSIGHTKEHLNDAWFEKLVRFVALDVNLKIIDFNHLAETIAVNYKDCSAVL